MSTLRFLNEYNIQLLAGDIVVFPIVALFGLPHGYMWKHKPPAPRQPYSMPKSKGSPCLLSAFRQVMTIVARVSVLSRPRVADWGCSQ